MYHRQKIELKWLQVGVYSIPDFMDFTEIVISSTVHEINLEKKCNKNKWEPVALVAVAQLCSPPMG